MDLVRRSVFDQIFRELREIHYRLDDIEKAFSDWKPIPSEISSSELFLLPDHLRKTFMIVASKGECNAAIVSNLTGRSRAIESSYLNQLARMGWLERRRELRSICFRLVSDKVLKDKAMTEAKMPARLSCRL
jgi:hypothetical protein